MPEKRYLQDFEADYIKANAAKLTSKQLSDVIGCSQPVIYAWCRKLGVWPTKSVFQYRKPVIPPLDKTLSGNLADTKSYSGTRYGNKSREELIDEILNRDVAPSTRFSKDQSN